jgi:hypothetical protein
MGVRRLSSSGIKNDSKVNVFTNNSLGTLQNPARNGRDIIEANPSAASGNYYLKASDGTVYQAYIRMDNGGGWINLNNGQLGPYTNTLTSGNGSGGGNMLSGGSSTAFAALGANFVNNSQAVIFTCGSYNDRSWVKANTTMLKDLAATEVRWNFSVQNQNNVTCGFINSSAKNITMISGNSDMIGRCSNSPTYTQQNSGSFTAEAYGRLMAAEPDGYIFTVYTACAGSFDVRLNGLYIR